MIFIICKSTSKALSFEYVVILRPRFSSNSSSQSNACDIFPGHFSLKNVALLNVEVRFPVSSVWQVAATHGFNFVQNIAGTQGTLINRRNILQRNCGPYFRWPLRIYNLDSTFSTFDLFPWIVSVFRSPCCWN